MTSYQKRKENIKYLEQCIKELEETAKILAGMIDKPKLPLGMGMKGDDFITPYNSGEFFGQLLAL